MNWINNRIPASALLFLLPMGLTEPPAPVILAAGRSGVFSFLFGFGLALAAALTAALLARRHPGLTFPRILRALFGRVLGKALAAAYALFWFSTAAWILSFEAAKVTDLYLPFTPVAVVVISLVGLGAYLVAHGVEPLSRWPFVVLPGALLVALLFYVFGIATGHPARLLEPPAGGVPGVMRDGVQVAGMLEEAITPLVLAGYFTRSGRLLELTLGGMAVGFVGLGTALAMVIAQFGVGGVRLYHWPAAAAVQGLTLPGFVLEKLDLVYLGAGGMLGVGHFALLYLFTALTLGELLGGVPLRTLTLALAPLLAGAALFTLPFDVLEGLRFYLSLPAWVIVYALPLLALGVSYLRFGRQGGVRAGPRPDRGMPAGGVGR